MQYQFNLILICTLYSTLLYINYIEIFLKSLFSYLFIPGQILFPSVPGKTVRRTENTPGRALPQ